MYKKRLVKRLSVMNILVLFLILLIPFLYVKNIQAAGFTQAYVRLDRLTASTATGGLVCADPVTAGTEVDVQVTFPTGFTVGSTAANWDVNTSNLPSGATAWPGIGTEATGVSGQVVTFSSTDLTHTGTVLYCFNFENNTTLTNHGTPDNDYTGTITTRASGPTTIDSSNYAVYIVTNDQITVTAAVPPMFTFSLSGNSSSLGDLSTTAAVSSSITITITTNAAAGWVAWVKSANAALNSVSTGGTIATGSSATDNTPFDLTASNYGYVLDVSYSDSGTGTGTVTQASNYGAEYNGDGTTSGGNLSTTFQPIAACDGTTGGDVLTLKEIARVTSVQIAATDYTDTLTVVGAGRF